MSQRKHKLVDCNPVWETMHDGTTCYVSFDCPEGHQDCRHTISFRQSLEGPIIAHVGASWDRHGDTFESLTLLPSIRRNPRYESKEAALAAGLIEEHITETLLCAMHVYIRSGAIEFCEDSR